jgi:hypothetical protein
MFNKSIRMRETPAGYVDRFSPSWNIKSPRCHLVFVNCCIFRCKEENVEFQKLPVKESLDRMECSADIYQ